MQGNYQEQHSAMKENGSGNKMSGSADTEEEAFSLRKNVSSVIL